MDKAELIWMNGEFVPWDEAKVHVLTHGLHYGTGVFEGIRCYGTKEGPAVFRHQDHLKRLYQSAELFYMPIPFELEELRQRPTSSSRATASSRATSARWPSAATARWGSTRSTRRSRSRSPCGRGAPTWVRTASASACARRCPRGGASARTRSSRTRR